MPISDVALHRAQVLVSGAEHYLLSGRLVALRNTRRQI